VDCENTRTDTCVAVNIGAIVASAMDTKFNDSLANELDEKRRKLERVAERIVQRHRERDEQEQKSTAAAERR